MNLLQQFEKEQMAQLVVGKEPIPDFSPGDNVCVHFLIMEGERQRIQKFDGLCIARRNAGLHSSFLVRKILDGFGVERTFPLFSPLIERIERTRQGKVRRQKLFYLRSLSRKKARVKEKVTRRK